MKVKVRVTKSDKIRVTKTGVVTIVVNDKYEKISEFEEWCDEYDKLVNELIDYIEDYLYENVDDFISCDMITLEDGTEVPY